MAGYNPLVYITDQGNGALNPNIYLTFTYKGEDFESTKTLYTSYPQLYKIRKELGAIRALIESGEGFLQTDDGKLVVRHTDPFVLANIGKQNKWISFKLVTIENTENGVSTIVPAVTVEMSDTNQRASVLTTDEFLTVCTIIDDLDLASIQCQMSLAYLSTDNFGAVPQRPAYQPQYQQQYMPQGTYQNYQQPVQYRAQNNQYQQPQQQYQRSQPRYNQGTTQYSQQPRQNNFRGSESQGIESPYASQNQKYTSAQQTHSQPQVQMPAREEKPIMNFSKVDETPISEINYDDSADIDSIFEEND